MSKAKLTKTATKCSAPIAPAAPPKQYGGEGGTITVPVSSTLGIGLIEQIAKAIRAHRLLDEHQSPIRTQRAAEVAMILAEALAVVPPKGAVEAMAAAILIYDDVDTLRGGSSEYTKRAAAERIEQRAVALASWIENTHRVSRMDYGFDYFCEGGRREQLLPHVATVLNVGPDFDA